MKFNKTTALLDKCYEVNLKVYGYVGKFPKAQKAVLGRQVLETANSLIDKITDALYLKDVLSSEEMMILVLKAQSNHFEHLDRDLREDMKNLRLDMKERFDGMYVLLRWMAGVGTTLAAGIFGLLFKMAFFA